MDGIMTIWIAIPGRAVTKAAVSHICMEYSPTEKINAFKTPKNTLPNSIAPTSEIYVLAYRFLTGRNCISSADAAPYAASSKVIAGRKKDGGIPVNRCDRSGVIMPAAMPKGIPQIRPQIRIGMCIGRKIRPA